MFKESREFSGHVSSGSEFISPRPEVGKVHFTELVNSVAHLLESGDAAALDDRLRDFQNIKTNDDLDNAKVRLVTAYYAQGKTLSRSVLTALRKSIHDPTLRKTFNFKEAFSPAGRVYSLEELGGKEITDEEFFEQQANKKAA